jgi:hypothetical protein
MQQWEIKDRNKMAATSEEGQDIRQELWEVMGSPGLETKEETSKAQPS